VEWSGGDAGKPVLLARIVRGEGFDDDVTVWVVLPDGSEYDMQRASISDPDLYK
jgi:hypothetical protein